MKLLCRILQWWTPVIIHLSESIKCRAPRRSPSVYHGSGVTIMCQCMFINSNNVPIHCWGMCHPVGDVDSRRRYTYVGAEGIWKTYKGIDLSPSFDVNLKRILKNSLFFFKKSIRYSILLSLKLGKVSFPADLVSRLPKTINTL